MTPKDASNLICPLMSGPVSPEPGSIKISTKTCIAASCAMWRWSDRERTAEMERRLAARIKDYGQGGKKPNPKQVQEMRQAVIGELADFTPTHGGCGMAGGV